MNMSVDQRIISRNPATNEPIWSGSLADDAAIVQAVSVATQFGLAAGIVTRERAQYEAFYQQTKAGIINWNQPLTGATTAAPFGGAKASGNYRSAGFLSVDYCSYPCASIEDAPPAVPTTLPAGVVY
jgi:succinylglutamate-semialdehyde dehydrogenase